MMSQFQRRFRRLIGRATLADRYLTAIERNNVVGSAWDERFNWYVPTQGTILDEVDQIAFMTPVEDQLDVGSCISNMVAEGGEALSMRAGIPKELSRMFNYQRTLKREGRLGQEGAMLSDALISGIEDGIPDEATWAYDPTKRWAEPSDAAIAEAARQRIRRVECIYHFSQGSPQEFFPQTLAGIKSALNEGLSVGIALRLGDKFRYLTGPLRAQNYPVVSSTNPWIGNHAMLVRAVFDLNYPYGLACKNSWSDAHGDKGYVFLSWGALASDLMEAWAIRGFADFNIRPEPGIRLEHLDRYNLFARIVPSTPGVFDVWVGAKLPDDRIFLKISDESWQPLVDGQYIPYRSQALIGEELELDVAKDFDLAPYAGVDVYAAYGRDVFSWQFAKLCTIGTFT